MGQRLGHRSVSHSRGGRREGVGQPGAGRARRVGPLDPAAEHVTDPVGGARGRRWRTPVATTGIRNKQYAGIAKNIDGDAEKSPRRRRAEQVTWSWGSPLPGASRGDMDGVGRMTLQVFPASANGQFRQTNTQRETCTHHNHKPKPSFPGLFHLLSPKSSVPQSFLPPPSSSTTRVHQRKAKTPWIKNLTNHEFAGGTNYLPGQEDSRPFIEGTYYVVGPPRIPPRAAKAWRPRSATSRAAGDKLVLLRAGSLRFHAGDNSWPPVGSACGGATDAHCLPLDTRRQDTRQAAAKQPPSSRQAAAKRATLRYWRRLFRPDNLQKVAPCLTEKPRKKRHAARGAGGGCAN
ncbi:hypothetical protein EDB80DRAFT_3813 [Ilyonectria destructans]|nr:hypothetical protein EDB80DRAFT_3813 [Ilyonectria destructans]